MHGLVSSVSWVRLLVVLGFAGLGPPGCGAEGGATKQDAARRGCVALRDHLVSIRQETMRSDADQHRAALMASLGGDFVTRCTTEIDPVRLRCLMDARDASAIGACATTTSMRGEVR